jgi:hypothetical protein
MKTTGVIWIYEMNGRLRGSRMGFAERESHEKTGMGD